MKLLTKLSGTITFKDKQKMRLLLIIFILEIVLFFILGQLYCEARKKMFSERVESVFKAVFLQHLQEDAFDGYFYTSGRKQRLEEYPDTVYITDESGKRGYCLDKEKSSKNVTSDPRLSFLHTAYLSKHPLVVDSLYEKWQLHLKQQSLSGTFALQLLVSDKDENITESVYPDSFLHENCIPEFDITAGYCCEVEVKGFFYFSFFTLVGVRGFVYGFIYWLCAVIINIVIFFRKRWQKNIVVPTSVHIYQMDQDIMFDADLRKLIFGKEEIQILPQTAILLKHFLEAPDYILKDKEIKKIFWSDKSNNDPRLHNAISRLRRVFENVPSIEIQRYENIGYQLQIRRNK